MGLPGRKRRLRNFEERTRAFRQGIEKNRPVARETTRDLHKIIVGIGQHRRLISKNNWFHFANALALNKALEEYLGKNKVSPVNYDLVVPKGALVQQTQEYFNRPTLQSLTKFLRKKAGRGRIELSREDFVLCKMFANQHKEITLERLLLASQELQEHVKKTNYPVPDPEHSGLTIERIDTDNIAVIGRTKEGKIRLAIVDV